jgi:hypothetical protein
MKIKDMNILQSIKLEFNLMCEIIFTNNFLFILFINLIFLLVLMNLYRNNYKMLLTLITIFLLIFVYFMSNIYLRMGIIIKERELV